MQHNKTILALLTLGTGFFPLATFAEVVPVSKCVTAATKASHVGYQARLEKDVAPYAENANAAKAIKAYRDGLAIDWEAMEEPYCGYGSYGSKSAIKSYTKSVERERSAFLAAVKTLAKGTVAAAVVTEPKPVEVVPVPKPVEVTAPVVVKPKPAPAVVEKKTAKISIPSGLRRGMRSESVKALQTFLAARYKISAADMATGFFGPMTEKYLIKFQLEKKLIVNASSPGAGLFGPKTAQALNK